MATSSRLPIRPRPFRNRATSTRPFVLRPRGRATVVVVMLGVPLLIAYGASRILPDALWFDELGQTDVLRRVLAAKLEFSLLVVVTVALFVGATSRSPSGAPRPILQAGSRRSARGCPTRHREHCSRPRRRTLADFLLWLHRQPFRRHRPDPRQRHRVLRVLAALRAPGVGILLVADSSDSRPSWRWCTAPGDAIGWRPVHATFGAQLHLAVLAAIFLARPCLETPPRAVHARARPAITRRRPVLLRRRLRGRQRAASRARCADASSPSYSRSLVLPRRSSPDGVRSRPRSGSSPSR